MALEEPIDKLIRHLPGEVLLGPSVDLFWPLSSSSCTQRKVGQNIGYRLIIKLLAPGAGDRCART